MLRLASVLSIVLASPLAAAGQAATDAPTDPAPSDAGPVEPPPEVSSDAASITEEVAAPSSSERAPTDTGAIVASSSSTTASRVPGTLTGLCHEHPTWVRFGRFGLCTDPDASEVRTSEGVSDEPFFFEDVEVREVDRTRVATMCPTERDPRLFLVARRTHRRGVSPVAPSTDPRERWGFRGSLFGGDGGVEIYGSCVVDDVPTFLETLVARYPHRIDDGPRGSWHERPDAVVRLGRQGKRRFHIQLSAQRLAAASLVLCRESHTSAAGDAPEHWSIAPRGACGSEERVTVREVEGHGAPPPGTLASDRPIVARFLGSRGPWRTLAEGADRFLWQRREIGGTWFDVRARCANGTCDETALAPLDDARSWDERHSLVVPLGPRDAQDTELLLAPGQVLATLSLYHSPEAETPNGRRREMWVLADDASRCEDSPAVAFRHASSSEPAPGSPVQGAPTYRGELLGEIVDWQVLSRAPGSDDRSLWHRASMGGHAIDIVVACVGDGTSSPACTGEELAVLRHARVTQDPDRRYQLRAMLGVIADMGTGAAGVHLQVGLPIYRIFGGGFESGFIVSFSRLSDDTVLWQLGLRLDYDISYLWREGVGGRNRNVRVALGVDLSASIPFVQTSIGRGIDAGVSISPFVDLRFLITPQAFVAVTLAPIWIFARAPISLATASVGGGIEW